MGLMQPYVGRFVSAKSASDKIDAEAIMAGCDAVDSEASAISGIASKVTSAANDITAEALSFDGVTVAGSAGECTSGIVASQGNIKSMTAQIKSLAMSYYNKFQNEYNEEAMAKDKAAIAEFERKNSERSD